MNLIVVSEIPEKLMAPWPAIIAEAGKTPLGFAALSILVIFVIAVVYFAKVGSLAVKLVVFCLLYILAAGAGAIALTNAAITPSVSDKSPSAEGLPEIRCGQITESGNRGESKIDLTVWNGSPQKRLVYWLDDKGTRVAMGALRPGEQEGWTTYQNDVWLVSDEADHCLGSFRISTSEEQFINVSR